MLSALLVCRTVPREDLGDVLHSCRVREFIPVRAPTLEPPGQDSGGVSQFLGQRLRHLLAQCVGHGLTALGVEQGGDRGPVVVGQGEAEVSAELNWWFGGQ